MVTIITVVFNCKKYIEETILSVINQTYRDFEYIIIDGGSTDGTVDIIAKYADEISYWISEPDKGIYDAMNKGIKVAKGDWFNFLNAGDRFVNDQIVEKIFSGDLKGATLIYGDIMVLKENGKSFYHKVGTLKDDKSIIRGMNVCHQAIFYNREIINFYDASLRLKAEWKHLIEMTRKLNFSPLKFDFPFVYYRLGGLSATLNNISRKEYKKVFLEEYGLLYYISQIPFLIYMEVRRISKKLLLKLKII
jgi:glycosyltransferase involved in cell wall biosynthesis